MTMTSWNALLHQFLITLMRFFSPFDPKFNNNTDIKARHRDLTPWPVALDHSDLLIIFLKKYFIYHYIALNIYKWIQSSSIILIQRPIIDILPPGQLC